MKPKTLALLTVAGGCGLFAMLGVQQAMRGNQGAVEVEKVKVLVAMQNIDTGARLNEANVDFKLLPKDSVPENALKDVEEYLERSAKVPLFANDVVTKEKLTEPGETGMSVLIPAGMRVFAINVDDTQTSSGLLRPGDRVDVLVTYIGIERNQKITKVKPLLEYVEVWACDNQTTAKMESEKNGNKAKVVSLLLTPEQVNFVALATKKGSIELAWRGRNDDELVQSKEIDEKLMEELSGTVGINEPFAMGGNSFALEQGGFQNSAAVSEMLPPAQPAFPVENNNATAAANFLSQQQGDVDPQAPPAVVDPGKPMWTMKIYNGTAVNEQRFEIPGKSEPEAAAAPVQEEVSSALSDLFKSALGKGFSKDNKNPVPQLDL